MVEYLLLRGKLGDFKQYGKSFVNSEKHANILRELLDAEYLKYTVEYLSCPLGEEWTFKSL